MGLRSPNELMDGGKELMLGGREPEGRNDAILLMNFLACNIHPEVAESACLLMLSIYPDIFEEVSREEVKAIVRYQLTGER